MINKLFMPSPRDFLEAFDLVKGAKFGDYKITKATATHEVVKQYQHYLFHITVTFSGGKDYNALYDDLMHEIRKKHNVKAIRNYYMCSIEKLKDGDVVEDNGKIIFHMIGHGYRSTK